MTNFGHRLALSIFVGVILLWGVAMTFLMHKSALPAQASGPMIVVFPPSQPKMDIFMHIAAADARLVRDTALPFIWVVTGDEGVAGRLVEQGALSTYRELPISPTIAGCFAYADTQIAQYKGP